MRRYLAAALLLFTAPLFASDHDPAYQSEFDSPQQIADWQLDSGAWQVRNNRFESSAAGASDRAILLNYHPQIPYSGMTESFDLDVYVLMRSGAAGASAGIDYDFGSATDSFYEVTLAPTGVAQLRAVDANGATVLASGNFAAPGANTWLHLNIVRRNLRTTVKVDGVPVIVNVPQSFSAGEQIALVTHNTSALFDTFNVRASTRTSPNVEDFNDFLADGFTPTDDSWSAASGVYATSAVRETTMSLSSFTEWNDFGMAPFNLPYTFKVRMLNPYGGSGNLVGVVIRSDPSNYNEIVFSPKGEAQMNVVTQGVRSRLATASYAGGGPNKWFEVEVTSFGDFAGGVGQVTVNGVRVFDTLPNDDLRARQIGLITHWAPGKFDDVRTTLNVFRPVSFNFDDNRSPPFLVPTASWRFENGRAHSTGITATELAFVDQAYEVTNIDYRVRMVNHYGASGNLVGLMYGLRDGAWYEVTFSATGVARLTRVQQGVTKVLATAPYSGGGPHVWFDVQLIQHDLHTTVRVNGTTVFNNVAQPDLGVRGVGLVTHWADAEFDDLSVQQAP